MYTEAYEREMNKTRLQELCHRKRWNPPEYSTRKDGPPHNPTFTATVTVGGFSFSTDHPARSSKEAQSNAAGLAIQYLTDPKPPPLADSSSAITDVKNIPATKGTSQPEIQATSQSHQAHEAFLVTRDDKKLDSSSASNIVNNVPATKGTLQVQIQETCQTPEGNETSLVCNICTRPNCKLMLKKKSPLPMYSFESIGPLITVASSLRLQLRDKPMRVQIFPTLKDAEHAAAKLALMSLSPAGFQEDDYGVYKNLLQEMARKEGYQLPVYSTERSGVSHMPTFLSTVEIEGETFVGQKAKTKKLAEMNAAKAAYTRLKESRSNLNHKSLSPSGQELRGVESSSFNSESSGTADLQQNIISKLTLVLKPSAAEQTLDRGGSGQKLKSPSKAVEFPSSSSPSSGVTDLPQKVIPQSTLMLLNQSTIFAEQDEDREVQMDPATRSSYAPSSPQNDNSSPPTLSENYIDLVPPEGNEDSACDKVIVFPSTSKISKPLPAKAIRRPVGEEWDSVKFSLEVKQ
ncbi:hypothetical protein AAG906_003552 [Vitis piasezkii]